MGFTVGLIIGGVLTFKVGYEWIFFLSAIVAGAQAILAFVIIPDDRDENRRLQEEARAVTAVASNDTNSIEASFWSTFDFLGAFLVTLALFFLVFFLTEGMPFAPNNIFKKFTQETHSDGVHPSTLSLSSSLRSLPARSCTCSISRAIKPSCPWRSGPFPTFRPCLSLYAAITIKINKMPFKKIKIKKQLIVGTSSVIALLFWMTQFWQYGKTIDKRRVN